MKFSKLGMVLITINTICAIFMIANSHFVGGAWLYGPGTGILYKLSVVWCILLNLPIFLIQIGLVFLNISHPMLFLALQIGLGGAGWYLIGLWLSKKATQQKIRSTTGFNQIKKSKLKKLIVIEALIVLGCFLASVAGANIVLNSHVSFFTTLGRILMYGSIIGYLTFCVTRIIIWAIKR